MGQVRREQRRSQRHRCRLPVVVTRGKAVTRAVTLDVSRHGVFLLSPDPPPERLLLKLTIEIEQQSVEATGFVTRRVAEGPLAGAGIQFFALSSQAKAHWDQFVSSFSGTAPPSWALGSEPPTDAPENTASFLIKLKDTQRLIEFFERKVKTGQVHMNTPLLKELDAPVSLVIIHPESEREFTVQGRVAHVETAPQKSMTIDIGTVTPKMVRRFEEFVHTGELSESMDLEQLRIPGTPSTASTTASCTGANAPEQEGDRGPEDDDVTATFDVDARTGDLSVDIEVEDESLGGLDFLGHPARRPRSSFTTLMVRCTECGAFLGPAPVDPVPPPLDLVVFRKTCFDRLAGSFNSKVLPRSAEALKRAESMLAPQHVPATLLVQLAGYWRTAGDDDLRGPDLAPALSEAASKLRGEGLRVRVEAPCPMCEGQKLFATWD
ncbi:MAG: PilZ domain-containing protein [Myxococcota bacterium]